MNKNLTLVIVLIAILIVIGGIWVVKNNPKTENKVDVQVNTNLEENKEIEETEELNSDFELEITQEFSLDDLMEYNLPMIIDFGADTCYPCMLMAADFEKVHEETKGQAILKFLDVWKYPELAEGYPLNLIPAQLLINSDGTPYAPENAEELGLEFYIDENENHILTMHVGPLTYEEMKTMLKEMGLDE